MKFNKILLISALIFGSFIQIVAQEAKWIRVQSDNGEFSIEVPENYNFFFDKDGFPVSDNYLREMALLNAYHEKTLISFESYNANKDALKSLFEREKRRGKSSNFKLGEIKAKQTVYQTENSYTVRQYFSYKNYIYILTSSSRQGETETMKRFFNSVKIGEKTQTADAKAVSFANLKATPIQIETADNKIKPAGVKPVLGVLNENDDSVNKIIFAFRPTPYYTDAARNNLSEGKTALRVTFSKNGWISKIAFIKILPDGLLRQSVFAAIRIKFLPMEKDNQPIDVTKIVEYTFDIY